MYKFTIKTINLTLFMGVVIDSTTNEINKQLTNEIKDEYNILQLGYRVVLNPLSHGQPQIRISNVLETYNELINESIDGLTNNLTFPDPENEFKEFNKRDYQINLNDTLQKIVVSATPSEMGPLMYYVSRPHDANISNVKCEGLLYDIIVQGIDIENTAGTTITPKQKNLFTSFTHAPSNKIVTFPTLINIDNYVHPVIDFINDNSPKPKIGKFTLEELQNHVLDQYGADTDVARKKLISKLFSKL